MSSRRPNFLQKFIGYMIINFLLFKEWFQKNCPVHIPTRRPKPPTEPCVCGKPFDRLIALDTGDGWMFLWECENYCGECDPEGINDWWPFLFGVWATGNQLERIGIEVL